jgi:hypothetical protein
MADHKKGGLGAMVTGIAFTAAAAYLSKPENRRKVKETVIGVKDKFMAKKHAEKKHLEAKAEQFST